jgi:hypothetical protein
MAMKLAITARRLMASIRRIESRPMKPLHRLAFSFLLYIDEVAVAAAAGLPPTGTYLPITALLLSGAFCHAAFAGRVAAVSA